jgi:hypothetical protein
MSPNTSDSESGDTFEQSLGGVEPACTGYPARSGPTEAFGSMGGPLSTTIRKNPAFCGGGGGLEGPKLLPPIIRSP